MPGTPTPILGLAVPTIGGDSNLWGQELNGDLAILDNLGAVPIVPFLANIVASAGVFPEKTYEGTTGSATITCTLPAASVCAGKIFLVIKVDAGTGSITIVGTINGIANYSLGNQWQYARIQSNGTAFRVIGNN
jgi:hypothetical protein